MNKQEAKGKREQVTGKVREEIGKFTNNKTEQLKGKIEQAEGKIREGIGKVQQKTKI